MSRRDFLLKYYQIERWSFLIHAFLKALHLFMSEFVTDFCSHLNLLYLQILQCLVNYIAGILIQDTCWLFLEFIIVYSNNNNHDLCLVMSV